MSQINPFTGSILQTPQVQRQQAREKDRHLQRVNDQAKNAALQDDHLEHQVESSDSVAAVKDDDERRDRSRRRKAGGVHIQPGGTSGATDSSGGEPHVDLTA
jgi:hypothetical protein